MNKYQIITISRQFGCSGRIVGQQVAQTLGIKYYDRELIAIAAEQLGYCAEFIEKKSEYSTPSPWDYFIPYVTTSSINESHIMGSNSEVLVTIEKVIKSIAEQGPCVIVGRAADYLLRDRGDVLNLFLYASKENRSNTIIGRGDCSNRDEALEMINRLDRLRRKNYKHITQQDWGDPANYDLCINTGSINQMDCVSTIVNLYQI